MNNHTTKFAFLIFGLVLAAGLSLGHAQWHEPLNPFPSVQTVSSSTQSIGLPVNSGPVSQIKDEGLGVNNLVASGNSQFDQVVYVGNLIRGGTPTGSNTNTVSFGGTDAGVTTTVDLNSYGTVYTNGTLRSALLSNPDSHAVCVDAGGVLILCP